MSIEDSIRAAVAAAVAPLAAEVRELRRTIQAREEGSTFGTPELERILGKRGSALREWLRRHPSFPRRRAGRKLVFDRAAVERWCEDNRHVAGAGASG